MRILNLGSLNLDHTYRVTRFVQPGETMAVRELLENPGGKGLNQSLALARAGAPVCHGGCVGVGGEALRALLDENGVDLTCLEQSSLPQGHAVIQVTDRGENCILLYGGSNRALTEAQLERTLTQFEPGDWLLLQNETNLVREIIERAHAHGMHIAFNPSPFDDSLREIDCNMIDWLLVNEVEAEQMTGSSDHREAWARLHARWPALSAVITLGGDGSACYTPTESVRQLPIPAEVVDTTGAGDTFTGYFLAGLMAGLPLRACMQRAAAAASICITRRGAAPAIPRREEVDAAVAKL